MPESDWPPDVTRPDPGRPDPGLPYSEPPYSGYPPGPDPWSAGNRPQPGPSRRRGRVAWRIAVVIAVLVLVGGASTAVIGYLRLAGPQQVVSAYFGALRSGDAPLALRYGRLPAGDRHFLTSAVLRVQQQLGPIGALSLDSVDERGNAAIVAVSYPIARAGATTTGAARISLHRASRRWRMDSTAALVSIDLGTAANRATLAGLARPPGVVALFPGAIPIVYDSDLLQQNPQSDTISLASTGSLSVRAELTAAGRARISDSVSAAMTRCLDQAAAAGAAAGAAPASCPLTPSADRAIPGSLRGKVTGFDASGDVQLVSDDLDGLISIGGTVSVAGTWATLDFDNQPIPQSGTTTVAVSAEVYVSAPDTVAWRPS